MRKGSMSAKRFESLVVILFRLIERRAQLDNDLEVLEGHTDFDDNKAVWKMKKELWKIKQRILKVAKKVIKNQILPKVVFTSMMYLYTVQVEHSIWLFDNGSVEIAKTPANGSWSHSVKAAVKSHEVAGGSDGWKLLYACTVSEPEIGVDKT